MIKMKTKSKPKIIITGKKRKKNQIKSSLQYYNKNK